MRVVFGKALLVITRLHEEGESAHYEVSTNLQSCSLESWEGRDWVNEEFQHLEYDVHPLPPPAYRLVPGETIRVAVTYYISTFQSFDGECDSNLDYEKFRVLRRQKPRKVPYQSKAKVAAWASRRASFAALYSGKVPSSSTSTSDTLTFTD